MRAETHSITWRGIRIAITFTPEKFGLVDHIELDSGDRTPLPVTETGYRSHFIEAGTVAEHGGAVAYVTAWLDYEAERTGWDGAAGAGRGDVTRPRSTAWISASAI